MGTNYSENNILTARLRSARGFMGKFRTIYDFGARFVPFYVSSVVAIVVVLFRKVVFPMFHIPLSSV